MAITTVMFNGLGSGTTTIATNPGGGAIVYVVDMFIVVNVATSLTFKSNTTTISGPMSFLTGGILEIGYLWRPTMVCAAGEDLNLTLSGLGCNCTGWITWDYY